MQQTAVRDERDADGDIQQAEAVEEEDAPALCRRGQAVEGEQIRQQPRQRVQHLDGELGGGVDEREQADVAGDGEGPEGAEVAAVAQRDQREGEQDQEDRFLVHVPGEEEGGVGGEGDGADEGGPGGEEEEADERGQLGEDGEEERGVGCDGGEHGK